jgi:hypothetical protein
MLLLGEDITDTYKKDLGRKIRQNLREAMEEDEKEELKKKKFQIDKKKKKII